MIEVHISVRWLIAGSIDDKISMKRATQSVRKGWNSFGLDQLIFLL